MTTNKVNNLEALYTKVQAEIRKSPAHAKPERKNQPVRKIVSKANDKAVVRENSKKQKWLRHAKLNKAEKKKRVEIKIKQAIAKS